MNLKKSIIKKIFRIEKIYNRYICQKSFHKIEQFSVAIAMLLFLVHLFAVFLNTNLNTPYFLSIAGNNYFGAIFTPFGIILFYEVFSLILAIPRDIASSLSRQYQIVSLIILLRVFKDVSKLEDVSAINLESEVFVTMLQDLGGALLLFCLIAIFSFSIQYRKNLPTEVLFDNLKVYKATKKVITLGLVLALIPLALNTLYTWLLGIFNSEYIGIFELQDDFFATLFVMLIFTDIVLVLLSYFFANTYSVIFTNAAFIVSAIFIRFSLSTERPTDIAIAAIAISIGILVNAIYALVTKKLAVFSYSYEI